MITKQELQESIRSIKCKIEEIENQLRILKAERSVAENKLLEIEKNDETMRILQNIHSVSETNSFYVTLTSNLRTTPIMHSFSSSDRMCFLILERAFTIYSSCQYPKTVSLVVSKYYRGINCEFNGLTMSDLKKISGRIVGEKLLFQISKDSREYPLYKQLVEIAKKPMKTNDIIPFSIPCMLGGQTFNDQTGFGSEYCGEYLVHQGKEYGETTKFLIIGVIVQ